ncbi:MAG: restriction endonuclease [Rhodospirillales bacterium]
MKNRYGYQSVRYKYFEQEHLRLADNIFNHMPETLPPEGRLVLEKMDFQVHSDNIVEGCKDADIINIAGIVSVSVGSSIKQPLIEWFDSNKPFLVSSYLNPNAWGSHEIDIRMERYAFFAASLWNASCIVGNIFADFPHLKETYEKEIHAHPSEDKVISRICADFIDGLEEDHLVAFFNNATELNDAEIFFGNRFRDVLSHRKYQPLIKKLHPSQDFEMKKTSKSQKGIEFEKECGNRLKKAGYEIRETPVTGDQGGDLICEKDEIVFVVQCKNSDRVGNKAVQEAVAAIRHYSADHGVVVAAGDFTRSAKELADTNNIILVNIEKLPRIDELAKMID